MRTSHRVTSTSATKGNKAPDREVPRLARPKARPRQRTNQLPMSALPTTPPQACPATHASANSAVNEGRVPA